MIRINSPGGSPVQAGRIYEAIERGRAEHPDKPIYAVIDEIGASGGYYVAAAADAIYADPASLVGSIGVISPGWDLTGLLDKLGIKRRALTAGESKALLVEPTASIESSRARAATRRSSRRSAAWSPSSAAARWMA